MGAGLAHAGWFDIDWNPDRDFLQNKLLVPFLKDQYGVELSQASLAFKFDEQEGTFAVWLYDTHKLPICPFNYARILGNAHTELERIGDAFTNLAEWRPQIVRGRGRSEGAIGARGRGERRGPRRRSPPPCTASMALRAMRRAGAS